MSAAGRSSSTPPTRPRASRWRSSRGRATSGSGISRSCSPTACSAPTCAARPGRPPPEPAAMSGAPVSEDWSIAARLEGGEIGEEIFALAADLYPICRSITGEGVRETLRRLSRHIPLTVHEVPTGTQVFDWTVPKEWAIRDAWIKNEDGERVVDFRRHNLHVL